MKKLRIVTAVFALAAATGLPVHAQNTLPTTMAVPTSDMTGQRVFNSDGDWIGTVTHMTADMQGQRLAGVSIEHGLSIKGTTVLFPTGSLQPREKGGYMTNLTGDQIKQLPKANPTNTP